MPGARSVPSSVVAGGAVGDLHAGGGEGGRVVAQVGVTGDAQLGQRPQAGTNPNTTWSPGASEYTPWPDLHHDAGALVAADHGGAGVAPGQIAGDEVLVAVAHAGGGELDQHLTVLRRVELDLLDAPRRVEFVQDSSASSHGSPPWTSRSVTRTVVTGATVGSSAPRQRGSTATWMN